MTASSSTSTTQAGGLFATLPNELLASVASELSLNGVANLACTSKGVRDSLSDDDSFWPFQLAKLTASRPAPEANLQVADLRERSQYRKAVAAHLCALLGSRASRFDSPFMRAFRSRPTDVVLGRVMDLACVSDPHLNLLLSAFRGSFTLETVVTSTGPFDLLNVKRELGLEGHSMSFLSAECLVPIWEACPEYQEHTQQQQQQQQQHKNHHHLQQGLGLNIPAPSDSKGFIGYAVNLLKIKPQHEHLRGTLFFTLLRGVTVWETTEDALRCKALPWPGLSFHSGGSSTGAADLENPRLPAFVALDGGFRKKVDVKSFDDGRGKYFTGQFFRELTTADYMPTFALLPCDMDLCGASLPGRITAQQLQLPTALTMQHADTAAAAAAGATATAGSFPGLSAASAFTASAAVALNTTLNTAASWLGNPSWAAGFTAQQRAAQSSCTKHALLKARQDTLSKACLLL